ncbi:MAG: VWA domain-containing protein [Prevotella sp.]|nr:VWA domain-containing protein [Prevotella sp.]MDY4555868.1 vWA domain-containing protein [Prevotella sp.]
MKRVFNMIIVDESGSMCVIERQALAGMNETIDTVKKMQKMHKDMEQRISLLTFDSGHKTFKYDNVKAESVHRLGSKDYNPCGGTPLYDAIGTAISKLNAQTTERDNVLVTIITDGEENCSQEYNLKMVKTLIDKMKKQGWTFTLIGTDNLDVEGMAGKMCIDNHLAFTQDDRGTREMFARENKARMRFNESLASGNIIENGCYFED